MAVTNKIVVLVAGDPPDSVRRVHGSYGDMIRRALAPREPTGWETVDARAASTAALEQALAESQTPAAVIVTGSSASVTANEPWMGRTARWLRELVRGGVPTLGICFGHQLLAQALGGRVLPNPAGQEIGSRLIQCCAEDPLLANLPPRFVANCFHEDTVARLPPGATVLAHSAADAHQCLRYADRCYGVQFHPEFDGPILRGIIAARAPALRAAGLPADQLQADVRDAPEARRVLQRFVELWGWGRSTPPSSATEGR